MEFLFLGFIMIFVILAVGNVISVKTKAFVPSIFTATALLVLGYWTGVIPPDLVSRTGMSGPLATICIYLMITHLGAMMSVRGMLAEWKTIAVAAAGIAGMAAVLLTVGAAVVGRQAVVVGIPSLAGGLAAATAMTKEVSYLKGLSDLANLPFIIYVMQGFIGYPLTAWCLRREGRKLLSVYRDGGEELERITRLTNRRAAGNASRLVSALVEKYQSPFLYLATLGVIALISRLTANWINFAQYMLTSREASSHLLHPLVICLIFGCIAAEIGVIERRPPSKCDPFGFMMAIVIISFMGTLDGTTPGMTAAVIVPLLGITIIGTAGLTAGAAVAGKLLGYRCSMAAALTLTALYGFPPNYMLTDEASRTLAENNGEYDFLMGQMLPKMLIGGFVAVTIASGIIVNIFSGLLWRL